MELLVIKAFENGRSKDEPLLYVKSDIVYPDLQKRAHIDSVYQCWWFKQVTVEPEYYIYLLKQMELQEFHNNLYCYCVFLFLRAHAVTTCRRLIKCPCMHNCWVTKLRNHSCILHESHWKYSLYCASSYMVNCKPE